MSPDLEARSRAVKPRHSDTGLTGLSCAHRCSLERCASRRRRGHLRRVGSAALTMQPTFSHGTGEAGWAGGGLH